MVPSSGRIPGEAGRHRKTAPGVGAARAERAVLHLVRGEGVVPALAGGGADPAVVETASAIGSLADVLAERGLLAEADCRGVGARIARALARIHDRGLGHGDVKPANVLFSPEGDLWLADFDAAGPLGAPRRRGTPSRLDPGSAVVDARGDVTALAILVVECATRVVIDPGARWPAIALTELGCPAGLAADVATILATAPGPRRVATILERPDDRLPTPPVVSGSIDPTPTIDFPSPAIAGLQPMEPLLRTGRIQGDGTS